MTSWWEITRSEALILRQVVLAGKRIRGDWWKMSLEIRTRLLAKATEEQEEEALG